MVKWKRKCCHMATYHPWPRVHGRTVLTGFCVVFYWWVFGCFVFLFFFTAFESAIRYCVSLAEGSAKAATLYAQMTKNLHFWANLLLFKSECCFVNTDKSFAKSHGWHEDCTMLSLSSSFPPLPREYYQTEEVFFRVQSNLSVLSKEMRCRCESRGDIQHRRFLICVTAVQRNYKTNDTPPSDMP